MTRRKKPTSSQSENNRQLAGLQAQEHYATLFDANEWQLILEELAQPLPPAVRLNLLKTSGAAALEAYSAQYGWQLKPVPFCPTGWQILSAQIPPSQTIEHLMGYYYIQDAASMLPVELFDFDGNATPLILDMAASPGGKTTHLIDRNGDRGLVIANDASASRLPALRVVLSNWGALNTAITNFPGEQIGSWFPETFDAVLLDAPCSMESLHSTASHPMRPITPRERQSLANRQVSLLASAVQTVKPGGQVVYSTCTLAPEEDEAVLDAVLSRFSGALEMTNAPDRLSIDAPALLSFQGQPYSPTIKQALRLWPHRFGTSGFFTARLIKTRPLLMDQKSSPSRPWEKTGLERVPPPLAQILASQITRMYGINRQLLDELTTGLWQRQNQIFYIPELFLTHFSKLPFATAGFIAGELIRNDFYPSHELLARFAAHIQEHQWLLRVDLAESWMRGEDLPISSEFAGQAGQIICIKNHLGIYMGRGKVLHDRLKNMLPRRLVQAKRR